MCHIGNHTAESIRAQIINENASCMCSEEWSLSVGVMPVAVI